MTKEELAQLLNNSEYPFYPNSNIENEAKKSNLVIISGHSDDLVVIQGKIRDEVDSMSNSTFLFHSGGVLCSRDELDTDEDVEVWLEQKKQSKEIKPIFNNSEYDWIYETNIPHATFDIIEGDEKYCKAMVIDLNNI